ncbi:hypothetical protein FJTKL_04210 [Diaporthe vaccinii]|uniref:Uncharacterized protein n=1 Tax=Diaporthe vaccinii TaxID=105482 RepID=A0ABR4DWP3_9PEZI
MKSTAAEIKAALAEWRSTNASRNKQRLKVYVDAIMNAEDDEADEEDLNKDRLDSLAALLEDTSESLAADGIGTPAEFLERFDELAPRYWLDGTEGGDCTPQQRADLSGREFAELETVLKERAPEGVVRDTIAVPEEFRVLARHVLGICGPHLPKDQHVIAMNFWADDVTQSLASRVHRPSDIPFGGAASWTGTNGLGGLRGLGPATCTRLPNLEGMSDGDILGGIREIRLSTLAGLVARFEACIMVDKECVDSMEKNKAKANRLYPYFVVIGLDRLAPPPRPPTEEELEELRETGDEYMLEEDDGDDETWMLASCQSYVELHDELCDVIWGLGGGGGRLLPTSIPILERCNDCLW